jgi:DNA-directed RNA polymerase III subunit RPC5
MQNKSDSLIASIPIILSNNSLHLHQFPLLARPLHAPPSARLAGKKITSRRKDEAGRMEIHLPLDLRQEVWNKERGLELGNARAQGDSVGQQEQDQDQEHRLTHLRLRSEQVADRSTNSYMIGILHDDVLHLHPISEIHQFKPSLTYLDVLSRPSRRKVSDSDDEDEDDGPPPDPDEVPPSPVRKTKKDKGKETEAKEVTITAKKVDDANLQGGLSTMRREMLLGMRKEQEEPWVDYDYSDIDVCPLFNFRLFTNFR